jgi:hypothetical protein
LKLNHFYSFRDSGIKHPLLLTTGYTTFFANRY